MPYGRTKGLQRLCLERSCFRVGLNAGSFLLAEVLRQLTESQGAFVIFVTFIEVTPEMTISAKLDGTVIYGNKA